MGESLLLCLLMLVSVTIGWSSLDWKHFGLNLVVPLGIDTTDGWFFHGYSNKGEGRSNKVYSHQFWWSPQHCFMRTDHRPNSSSKILIWTCWSHSAWELPQWCFVCLSDPCMFPPPFDVWNQCLVVYQCIADPCAFAIYRVSYSQRCTIPYKRS